MAPRAASARLDAAAWINDLAAGVVGSLSVLAVPVTLGLIAFTSLGGAAIGVGLHAAFVCAALGGCVYGLLGRTVVPAAGPSSATALTLAGLAAQLAAEPALSPAAPEGVLGIVALCGVAVMLAGALQMLLALLGVARLARFVPQPVLGGFMNGVAVLILLAQLPLLVGHAPGAAAGLHELWPLQPGAVVLGLATAGLLWVSSRRWPRAPTMLLALLVGTTVDAALRGALPQLALGARIGAVAGEPLWPWALLSRLATGDPTLGGAHLPVLAGTALLLAVIGALETALNNLALDQVGATRHDPRRELLAIGATNFVVGALGGLPVVALRARAMAILQSGGRGRGAAVGGSVVLGGLYLFGEPVLAVLPLPVLAGIMAVIALTLIDRWTRTLLAQWWAGERSRELLLGLGVVTLVGLITIFQGFGAAVALGTLLSILVFFTRMSRSLVRQRCTAAARPSRRIYPGPVEARLRGLREQITIFELEGALFFGSGERLLAEAETLPPNCRCLVLDLRRVSTIDETGAMALQQLAQRLRRQDVELLPAGVAAGSPQAEALRAFGSLGAAWPDVDRAVEAAERRLVGDMPPGASVLLSDCSLMQGLDGTQRAAVAALLQPRTLAAGESLFAEGDAADCLYVLTRGSVSVISRADAQGRTQRYLSISPGMMFGETAMLDGGGRSAGVVADVDASVFALTQADLDRLTRLHPELAARLYRNIAVHLSERLRSAAAAWNASLR